MDTSESPQAALQRMSEAQQAFELGEHGLRLLRQSRAAFVQSLRATGLTYAQACTKYDNCLQDQIRLHQAAIDALQFETRRQQYLATHSPTED